MKTQVTNFVTEFFLNIPIFQYNGNFYSTGKAFQIHLNLPTLDDVFSSSKEDFVSIFVQHFKKGKDLDYDIFC